MNQKVEALGTAFDKIRKEECNDCGKEEECRTQKSITVRGDRRVCPLEPQGKERHALEEAYPLFVEIVEKYKRTLEDKTAIPENLPALLVMLYVRANVDRLQTTHQRRDYENLPDDFYDFFIQKYGEIDGFDSDVDTIIASIVGLLSRAREGTLS